MEQFTTYLDTIARINALGNGKPVQWFFYPGMLFLSRAKWWGDFKTRASDHEGIDITYFKTDTDTLGHFDDSIKVPAIADGVILNICNDFLGQTLVVEYEKDQGSNYRGIVTYAHVETEPFVKIGVFIQKGTVIARVCKTVKNPQLPPHLHFSCFQVCCDIASEDLNWNLFSKLNHIHLVNPVFL
ncbi:MAG: M23 family metallopeptidase [Pseudomonadota bacterium]